MPGCGGVYTNDQGEIRSPSLNGVYPTDITCEYKIVLSENNRIKITFLSFKLEDSELCEFDYVKVIYLEYFLRVDLVFLLYYNYFRFILVQRLIHH